jgi:hypothetical protein
VQLHTAVTVTARSLWLVCSGCVDYCAVINAKQSAARSVFVNSEENFRKRFSHTRRELTSNWSGFKQHVPFRTPQRTRKRHVITDRLDDSVLDSRNYMNARSTQQMAISATSASSARITLNFHPYTKHVVHNLLAADQEALHNFVNWHFHQVVPYAREILPTFSGFDKHVHVFYTWTNYYTYIYIPSYYITDNLVPCLMHMTLTTEVLFT